MFAFFLTTLYPAFSTDTEKNVKKDDYICTIFHFLILTWDSSGKFKYYFLSCVFLLFIFFTKLIAAKQVIPALDSRTPIFASSFTMEVLVKGFNVIWLYK